MTLHQLRHERDVVGKAIGMAQPKAKERLTAIAQQKHGWEQVTQFLMHKLNHRLRESLARYVELCKQVAVAEQEVIKGADGPTDGQIQS